MDDRRANLDAAQQAQADADIAAKRDEFKGRVLEVFRKGKPDATDAELVAMLTDQLFLAHVKIAELTGKCARLRKAAANIQLPG